MNSIIVYSPYCLKCVNKTRWKEIERFAILNGYQLEERRTNYSKVYQQEASEFSDKLPIVTLKDKFISVSGNLEDIL
jgi:hypothetical protein